MYSSKGQITAVILFCVCFVVFYKFFPCEFVNLVSGDTLSFIIQFLSVIAVIKMALFLCTKSKEQTLQK